MTAILRTNTAAELVSAINNEPIDGEVTIQGGIGGARFDYVITPSTATGTVLTAKRGVRVVGDGADSVRISIAKPLTGWAGSGPRWTWTGTVPGPSTNTDTPSGANPGWKYDQAAYYETVYVDDLPLWKIGVKDAGVRYPAGVLPGDVGTISPPGPGSGLYGGTCYIDYDAGVITIDVNPSGKAISVTRPNAVFSSSNPEIIIEGLEVFGGATAFQAGGSVSGNQGDNQIYLDLRAYGNARGCQVSAPCDSVQFIRFESCWNFQYGVNGQGDYLYIVSPHVHHNNHGQLFNAGNGNYGSGGSKFVGTGISGSVGSGVTITGTATAKGNWHDNWGGNIWNDLSNIEYLFEWQVSHDVIDSVVGSTASHGIHNEVGYKGTIRNCDIYNCSGTALYNSTSMNVTVDGVRIWSCGTWNLRNNDTSRTQTAVWGTHRATGNVYKNCEIWYDLNATTGGQESFADNQGWTTCSWLNNIHHVGSGASVFQWDSGTPGNFATWDGKLVTTNETLASSGTAFPDPFGTLPVADTGFNLYVSGSKLTLATPPA